MTWRAMSAGLYLREPVGTRLFLPQRRVGHHRRLLRLSLRILARVQVLAKLRADRVRARRLQLHSHCVDAYGEQAALGFDV